MKFKAKKDFKFDKKIIEIAKELKMSPITINFLFSKGYNTVEKIKNLLSFDRSNLRSVDTYKDIEKFYDVLIASLKNHEEITICGDYDCDGCMATVIWYRALSKFKNSKINYFINHRFKEGYGINVKSMERCLQEYPNTNLILTCDNGIVAFDAVKYLQDKGLKVLITDHHIAKGDGELPNCPVIDEWRLDENESLREAVCGAELSRRLVEGLYQRLGFAEKQSNFLRSLFSYSGIATISDCVSLGSANHFIVKYGLEQIENNNNPNQIVFQILKNLLDLKEIDEQTIGFRIAPLVNAVSRIEGDITKALKLFTSDDANEITSLVNDLITINEKRQDLTKDDNNTCKKEVEEKYKNDSCLVIANPNFEEGICGLSASFLVENYNKPALVLTEVKENPGVYKGSARSITGVHIKECLDKCSNLLLGYGGHAGAAGFSLKAENIDKFRKKMNEIVSKIDLSKEPVVEIDFLSTADEIDLKLIQELYSLAPFGQDFERPTITVYGKVNDYMFMGKEKNHLSLHLQSINKPLLKVIYWNGVEEFKQMQNISSDKEAATKEIAVIGKWQISSFNGQVYHEIIANRQMFIEKEKIELV